MKKIVAIVLAMVMVLGLATVAFADTTASTVKAEGYSLLDMDTNEAIDVIDETFAKVVTDKVVTTVGDVTTTTYFADMYDFGNENVYFACDATIADAKLVKAGKVVAYLSDNADIADGATKTATAFVKANKVPACGEFQVDTYVVAGKNYAVGTDEFVVFNGKFVGIAAAPCTAVEPHVFAKMAVTTDTKATPVAIACDVCKASFKVVDAIPADYTGTVDAELIEDYIVLMDAYTAAAGTTTEKVESAQTFDAGIAMYVGMSVMAAAGSAVVLKKKD